MNVILGVLFAKIIFDEQPLRVICKSLVYPHIGSVPHRDIIAKPLVA
jgi:hypothetical protein